MRKRIVSAVMALILCLTLLPAPAWAVEADAPEGGTIVQEEQEKATTEGNGQSTNTGCGEPDRYYGRWNRGLTLSNQYGRAALRFCSVVQ